MKTIRLFVLLSGLLCLGAALPLWADTGRAAELAKEIAQVQQKIEQLDKLEATQARKQLRDGYQQVLAAQQDLAGYLDKARGLDLQIKEHAERGKELRRALDEAAAGQPGPDLEGKPAQALEAMLEAEATEKITLQNQIDEAQTHLAQLQARLLPAQNELAEAKKGLERAAKDLRPPASPLEPALAGALLLKKKVGNEARIAQIQALDLELLSIPSQMELAGLRKTLLAQKLKNLNQRIEKIQARLGELRRAESARIVDASLHLRQLADEDPALAWLAEENVALGNMLTAYVANQQALADRLSVLERQAKLVEQRHIMLRQQLDLGEEAGGIGELMRQTLWQLETLGEESVPKTIEDIRKAQIQSLIFERQFNELADKAGFVQAAVERFPNSQLTVVNSAMRERLNSLLELRGNLLAKLLERNQQSLKSWSLLLNAQNQFNDQIRLFDKLLKEHLLWTATNPAMSPAWLAGFAADLWRVDWFGAWEGLAGVLGSRGWLLAVLAVVFVLLRNVLRWHLRPRFKAWQAGANAGVGDIRRDAFRNTLAMLAGELAFALPVPLLLFGLKKLLAGADAGEVWIRLLGEGLGVAAKAGLMLGFVWRLAKPGGFLQGQLGWPRVLAGALARQLRWRWLLVLLASYVAVTERQGGNFFRYEFGRLPFLLLCLLVALMLRRLARAWGAANTGRADAAMPWPASLFILCELGLATMDLFGFHLGALVLQGRLLATLGWALAVLLGHQILQRWLLLEQRRMAYAHAMAVREELRAGGGEEGGGERHLDDKRREFAEIQTISQQSKTLLALASAAAIVVAAGWTWADMLPAFSLLDEVALWESGVPGGGSETVTLKSLLLALAAVALAVLAVRNLPGLVELLVLQHLGLSPGTDFAVTTLLKYGIVAVGVVTVCKLLGLQWEELQWLVAALSVGLGFGLQEIFANFISGLIILFEKPVRIGDVVTLNNGVTGTIDAINTRSTTLTDWDNKEIIIPNKSLITEQLTNWSLSSQVIRVIVPVGIAYGSDTVLAHRLLLQAAEEHPLVLDKPEKIVLFRAFGASSLDFELRCFVANPNVRAQVLHDLNMRIDQLFREHGVEIAFPQMDLHIRDIMPGP